MTGDPADPPHDFGRAGSPACLVNSSLYTRADATGGDPYSPVFNFSPHIARALLDQEACVHSVWPAFSDPRAAAHAAKQSRLRIVISAAVCEASLLFAVAVFVAHGAPRSAWSHLTSTGMTLFSWIRALAGTGGWRLVVRGPGPGAPPGKTAPGAPSQAAPFRCYGAERSDFGWLGSVHRNTDAASAVRLH
jgi:hypothetical protein